EFSPSPSGKKYIFNLEIRRDLDISHPAGNCKKNIAGIVPKWGKQLAPVEKAPCPCWASSVPQNGIFCTENEDDGTEDA
ncbi:MAG: hypothetical protein SO214_01815, partial [Prevotella pectinovora]|uniref:hypothetical protein n=1 Tax=Prevotella pectinovora TaxID=1602169 RepID=UPI002A80EFB2